MAEYGSRQRYQTTPPGGSKQGRQRYVVNKPGQPRQEYLTSRALEVAEIPGGLIEQLIVPPRHDPFPPRFGYESDQPRIEDVLSTSERNPDYRYWVSGGPADFTATSRPSGEGWQ